MKSALSTAGIMLFVASVFFGFGCGKHPPPPDASCVGNLSRLGKGVGMFVTEFDAPYTMEDLLLNGYVHADDTYCPVAKANGKHHPYRIRIGLRQNDPERCVLAVCDASNHHRNGSVHALTLGGDIDAVSESKLSAIMGNADLLWGTTNLLRVSELKSRCTFTNVTEAQVGVSIKGRSQETKSPATSQKPPKPQSDD